MAVSLTLPVDLSFTHKLGATDAHTGIFPEAQKLPGRFYRTSPLVQKDVGSAALAHTCIFREASSFPEDFTEHLLW